MVVDETGVDEPGIYDKLALCRTCHKCLMYAANRQAVIIYFKPG